MRENDRDEMSSLETEYAALDEARAEEAHRQADAIRLLSGADVSKR
jgi:hypothetical protein